MKIIGVIPFALTTLGVLGCSQHASTAPAVERPAATANETNTFGESKDEAAGSAASARDANYGSTPAPDSNGATAPDAAVPKTAPDTASPK